MKRGDRFGELTVTALMRGAKGVHPLANCRCACGSMPTYRQTDLRRKLKMRCRYCAWRLAWKSRKRIDAATRAALERLSQYRCNARAKGLKFALTPERCFLLFRSACAYCGAVPAKGIDRQDSAAGYVEGNVVPCCWPCNSAKKSMTVSQFISWVRKVYENTKGLLQ